MSEIPPPFIVKAPSGDALPVVVSIPHTGTEVPPEIAAGFASAEIRALPMTDWHLHRLYDFLPGLGFTIIHAVYSRFVADLNRPPDARPLYPGRFETGLVAERTFDGREIWRHAPDATEIARRRTVFHAPYHERLRNLLDDTRSQHGKVVLIDAHSVASAASLLHGPLENEIYLGNRDGASCGDWLIDWMDGAFTRSGLRVSRNRPYKGGYITDHYGGMPGVEALQIEMCQRVYMDESTPEGAPGEPRFARARETLRTLFSSFAEEFGPDR